MNGIWSLKTGGIRYQRIIVLHLLNWKTVKKWTAEEQEEIFNEKVQAYMNEEYSRARAERIAKEWVALPGTSEHQLGIAVDINADKTYSTNDEVYEWLVENAYKYGFILRYPRGKEKITGTAYEPWHYRYVGGEIAEEIFNDQICLEEYLENNMGGLINETGAIGTLQLAVNTPMPI